MINFFVDNIHVFLTLYNDLFFPFFFHSLYYAVCALCELMLLLSIVVSDFGRILLQLFIV